MSASAEPARRLTAEQEAAAEALFAAAMRAIAAGDALGARHWLEAVVELGGRRAKEARRYLAGILLSARPSHEDWAEQAESAPATAEAAAEEAVAAADYYDDGSAAGVEASEQGRGQVADALVREEPGPLFKSVAHPGAAAPPPALTDAATLRRTPHLALAPDGPPAPGTTLSVSIWADTGPFLPGERGDEIVVAQAPEQIQLEVWLVTSEHFAIEGPDVQALVLRRDEARSPAASFTVRVRNLQGPDAPPAAGAFLSALFAYRGRPCGRVTRTIELAPARSAATAAPPPAPPPSAALSIETAAEPADLIVRVVAGSLSDGRAFECRVQTRLLPAYAAGASESWRLADLAPEVVASYLKLFTAKGVADQVRTFALRGAGIGLFEASSKLFQRVFWDLVDAGKLPRTISIVSEEPTFPWELMVPSRTLAGEEEQREPLGVEFLVSRWTARDQVHPVQRVTLGDCYVVAPTDSKLTQAAAEAKMILDRFEPGTASLIDPAGIVKLDVTLGAAGRALLHFVCHGKSGGAAGQTLVLQDREELNSSFLRAMPGVKKGFRAAKPLVFLNACEVGRPEPALVGVGGFAEAFMALGASAVIAPLWSVKDSIAHDVAVEFYERSRREPTTPFAEILRDLRRRSYAAEGGEDSWAAYCFYGDPLATAA